MYLPLVLFIYLFAYYQLPYLSYRVNIATGSRRASKNIAEISAVQNVKNINASNNIAGNSSNKDMRDIKGMMGVGSGDRGVTMDNRNFNNSISNINISNSNSKINYNNSSNCDTDINKNNSNSNDINLYKLLHNNIRSPNSTQNDSMNNSNMVSPPLVHQLSQKHKDIINMANLSRNKDNRNLNVNDIYNKNFDEREHSDNSRR